MTECDYCGEKIPKTEGKILVKTSGEKLNFCSGKCEKNWKKNRSHKYPEKEK